MQQRIAERSSFATPSETAFAKAQVIIATMPGYLGHELQRCLEVQDKYVLLVRWRSVEDHEQGFRQSPQYQEWKRLLHHFYQPFPVVEHFEFVEPGNGEADAAAVEFQH